MHSTKLLAIIVRVIAPDSILMITVTNTIVTCEMYAANDKQNVTFCCVIIKKSVSPQCHCRIGFILQTG